MSGYYESRANTLQKVAAERELGAEIERLRAVLNHVADNTYCGMDAEWHFKPGYDPQVVLDALGAQSGRGNDCGCGDDCGLSSRW